MITLSRRIMISASRESVGQYLRDLRNVPRYERKIEQVEVSYPDESSGLIEAAGRLLGLPWRGAFRMDFTRDGGFRAEMVRGPLPRLTGGFQLRVVSGGTVVTQEQQLQLPVMLRPLAPLVRRWLIRSMDRRLFVIKEGAERLHRQVQIRQLESSR